MGARKSVGFEYSVFRKSPNALFCCAYKVKFGLSDRSGGTTIISPMEGLTSVAWHCLENSRAEIRPGSSNLSPSAQQ